MIAYQVYQMSVIEKLKVLGIGVLRIILLAYFFYGSFWFGIFISPFLLLYFKEEKERRRKQRLWSLNLEFRELLLMLAALLQAGYSVEKALIMAKEDLELLFGKKSDLVKELVHMESALRSNITLEEVLEEFSLRSGLEDIEEFYSVFSIAKKNGGNINHILRYGAEKIFEKIQVKEEIQILISARAYELKLMTIIPAFIILYLSVTSPGYFQVLYFNPIGILIMSICLLIYIFAYYIGKKILNIPV